MTSEGPHRPGQEPDEVSPGAGGPAPYGDRPAQPDNGHNAAGPDLGWAPPPPTRAQPVDASMGDPVRAASRPPPGVPPLPRSPATRRSPPGRPAARASRRSSSPAPGPATTAHRPPRSLPPGRRSSRAGRRPSRAHPHQTGLRTPLSSPSGCRPSRPREAPRRCLRPPLPGLPRKTRPEPEAGVGRRRPTRPPVTGTAPSRSSPRCRRPVAGPAALSRTTRPATAVGPPATPPRATTSRCGRRLSSIAAGLGPTCRTDRAARPRLGTGRPARRRPWRGPGAGTGGELAQPGRPGPLRWVGRTAAGTTRSLE